MKIEDFVNVVFDSISDISKKSEISGWKKKFVSGLSALLKAGGAKEIVKNPIFLKLYQKQIETAQILGMVDENFEEVNTEQVAKFLAGMIIDKSDLIIGDTTIGNDDIKHIYDAIAEIKMCAS